MAYEVWRSTVSGSGYELAATAGGRTTSAWTDTGTLTPLTTSYYVVRTISPNWTSVSSNQVSVSVVLS